MQGLAEGAKRALDGSWALPQALVVAGTSQAPSMLGLGALPPGRASRLQACKPTSTDGGEGPGACQRGQPRAGSRGRAGGAPTSSDSASTSSTRSSLWLLMAVRRLNSASSEGLTSACTHWPSRPASCRGTGGARKGRAELGARGQAEGTGTGGPCPPTAQVAGRQLCAGGRSCAERQTLATGHLAPRPQRRPGAGGVQAQGASRHRGRPGPWGAHLYPAARLAEVHGGCRLLEGDAHPQHQVCCLDVLLHQVHHVVGGDALGCRGTGAGARAPE